MKKTLLFLGLTLLILNSCEKKPVNVEITTEEPASLKHNSYVTQSQKTEMNGMPELLVSKNGVAQSESLGKAYLQTGII